MEVSKSKHSSTHSSTCHHIYTKHTIPYIPYKALQSIQARHASSICVPTTQQHVRVSLVPRYLHVFVAFGITCECCRCDCVVQEHDVVDVGDRGEQRGERGEYMGEYMLDGREQKVTTQEMMSAGLHMTICVQECVRCMSAYGVCALCGEYVVIGTYVGLSPHVRGIRETLM